MSKDEIEKIVKTTYDTVIKGPADTYVNMDIPELKVTMKCLARTSGRMIQVDVGSCWLSLQSWKYDRKTIIRTISDFIWMMMN